MTAVQTLEVPYGLVQNMKEVMDGEQSYCIGYPLRVEYPFPVDSKVSITHVQDTLGTLCGRQ